MNAAITGILLVPSEAYRARLLGPASPAFTRSGPPIVCKWRPGGDAEPWEPLAHKAGHNEVLDDSSRLEVIDGL